MVNQRTIPGWACIVWASSCSADHLFYVHWLSGRRSIGRECLHHDRTSVYRTARGKHRSPLHIARKYNGEWILADGTLAFNLEGCVVHEGSRAYKGTMQRGPLTIIACECSDAAS